MPEMQLSLCMIVRDEAEMLPDFLASVAGLWDEFIAVDTGSADSTVELLEAAGARIHTFEWCDDFSAARNASLAPATGRWILFLDADERVSPRLAEQIRSLVGDSQAGAATVLMRNEIPGGQVRLAPLLRLFRNDPSVRFEHRIHEDPSRSVQDLLTRDGLQLRHLDGVVDHLGYVREVASDRNKKRRDLDLLQRSLAADPDDFYCWFKVLEIARFWEDGKLWSETAAAAAAQISSASDRTANELKASHWGGEFFALISQGLFDDASLALHWMDDHAAQIRPSVAWFLRRGFNLESAGRPTEAEAAYRECLTLARNEASTHTAIRPLLGLCRLAASTGDLSVAQEFAREAASLGPVDPEALLALAAFHPPEDGQTISSAVRELLATHVESAVPLARAYLSLGQVERASECLRPMSKTEAEAALGWLLCSLILGHPVELAVDLTQDEADRIFRSWIQVLLHSRQPAAIRDFLIGSPAVAEVFPWLSSYLEENLETL